MTDRTPDPAARPASAFDKPDGFSGQDYHRDDEAAEGRRAARPRPAGGAATDAGGVPPEAGHRPTIDPATGVVHGAGSGAGGGRSGEDYDDDRGGSDLPVATGAPSPGGNR